MVFSELCQFLSLDPEGVWRNLLEPLLVSLEKWGKVEIVTVRRDRCLLDLSEKLLNGWLEWVSFSDLMDSWGYGGSSFLWAHWIPLYGSSVWLPQFALYAAISDNQRRVYYFQILRGTGEPMRWSLWYPLTRVLSLGPVSWALGWLKMGLFYIIGVWVEKKWLEKERLGPLRTLAKIFL